MTLKPITEAELSKAIQGATSIKQVLQRLGRKVNNGGYQTVRAKSIEFGIELPKHTPKGGAVLRKIPDEEFFVTGVRRSSGSLKKRLVEDHGVIYECSDSDCAVKGTWKDKKLSLQLDHIDGDRFNNTLENLRLLCHNCHAQTDTYANNRKSINTRYNYCSCGVRINRVSERCRECEASRRIGKPVLDWISEHELVTMVKETNYLQASKKLGVSDNGIRKRLRSLGYDTKTLEKTGI